jgi:anthranilate synthase component 1
MNISDRKKTILTPVVTTLPADLLTPLAVYLKLSRGEPYSFLLESVEGGENLARYSFIGADPRMVLRSKGDKTLIQANDHEEMNDKNVVQYLGDYFATFEMPEKAEVPTFAGGAIGYLGFECVEWFEPTLRRDETDDLCTELMIFDTVIAFDHVKQLIHVITLSRPDGGDFLTPTKALVRNDMIRRTLENGSIELPKPIEKRPSGDTTSNFSQGDFEKSVSRIKEMIKAGECYQTVLSQRFERETHAHPVAIYRALRSLNPAPYMFLLQLKDRAVVGASPEMLVRCRGRKLEYSPIAGTRPRSDDTIEDGRLAEEMRQDPKEVAEHMMLVDLGRNDLGRVSKFGSVNVDRLMEVEKYSHVQHLVSQLSSVMDDGSDQFDAFAACFPAGTVSGAPKVRAIEIIRELEPNQRGVYAGAVGYFDYAGNMDTCIAIRTLVLESGVAKIQAGAGIVADSEPASEYQETVNKAKAMIRAIDIAEGRA